MYLDKQHPIPIYLQLKEMLQNQIEQGIYHSHQKLPSERDLCQYYNLSRMTARRALKELVNEGLVYTRVGKGTFVSYKPNNSTDAPVSKTERLSNLNFTTITKVHYQQRLVDLLLSFNCVETERIIREALATYSVEAVALKLFPEVIRELEQRWHNGEASLLAQNYAITTLRSQLAAMVNASTTSESGPKLLLACAPEDQHEIGLLLLALILRRRGYLVIYLGPNVTSTDYHQVIDTVQPQLICFSAATTEAGKTLIDLSQQYQAKLSSQISNDGRHRLETNFTFGGVAFIQNPSLISRISGLYLGDTIETAVTEIEKLFSV